MNLNQVLKQLKETRTLAESAVAGDFTTRPGREAARNGARQQLPGLKKDFTREFKKVGFAVFVDGKETAEFAKLATEEAEVVVVDLNKLLEPVRAAARASIGNRKEYGIAAFSSMVREIKEIAYNAGLSSISAPNFDLSEVVSDSASVDTITDRYITRYFADELLVPLIETAAADIASSTLDCESATIPVLIFGLEKSLVNNVGHKLMQGNFISVKLNESVTKEDVVEVFESISAKLK